MKLVLIRILCLWLITCSSIFAQEKCFPDKTDHYVHDEANLLTSSQINSLNHILFEHWKSTSNEIHIVLPLSLCGDEKAHYSYKIIEDWGIGSKKDNNGLVIMVKPKTPSENGEAFIATGYGIEPYVTDAEAFYIVNDLMITEFKKNDYYAGINNGVIRIIGLLEGTYEPGVFPKKDSDYAFIIFLIIIFIIIIYFSSKSNNGFRTIDKGGTTFYPTGSFGGGSSSGSFGGFGGGSSGGGGAGGSW